MQVWRWHLTMLTSILHRASGLGLYGGALIAAGWAVALAQGPETYGWYKALLGSLPGNPYPDIRRPMISTLSLADLMPMSAVWTTAPTVYLVSQRAASSALIRSPVRRR